MNESIRARARALAHTHGGDTLRAQSYIGCNAACSITQHHHLSGRNINKYLRFCLGPGSSDIRTWCVFTFRPHHLPHTKILFWFFKLSAAMHVSLLSICYIDTMHKHPILFHLNSFHIHNQWWLIVFCIYILHLKRRRRRWWRRKHQQ